MSQTKKLENWKIGRNHGCVVTDTRDGFGLSSGHLDEAYYGGVLICESIWREKDAHLIAAAPKMLEALQNLENDNNVIPEHSWKMVQDAIALALNLQKT